MKHIAVICKDLQDFENWKDLMKLNPDKVDTRKRFTVGDTTYCCIYKPTHTISMTFDSVVETKDAKKGGAYASTITQAKLHLKHDPQLKLNFE